MLTHLENECSNVILERQAVKRFDPSFRMDEQEMMELLEIAHRAPSAWNLQHWHFLVVMNPSEKELLLPVPYGQRQVVDAAAVVAVLGNLEAFRDAEKIYEPDVQRGQLSVVTKQKLMEQIESAYVSDPAYARDDAIRNGSLAAMQLMIAAKTRGLDTGPIGGFSTKQFMRSFAVPPQYISSRTAKT